MKAPFLVMDIETVLDPALPIAESSEAERLPAPAHHQIVAIGALWLTGDYGVRRLAVLGAGKDEAGMLREFSRVLEERRPCLVTFNGRSFDLPVIATRSFRHGVALRHYYQAHNVRYRFSSEGHFDVMDYLADFGAAKPSRLDVIAKLCGMPGKVGVDGKHVGPLVHAGRLDEVQSYCLCDVVQTTAIFLRLELVRGELLLEAYRHAMGGLLELVRGDERLRPVSEALDEERLMLREPGLASSPVSA